MGTSSMIGYIKEDGTVATTYCHYDGYVEYNGRLLLDSFNTPEKAKEVAETGYLSGLKADLEVSKSEAVHKEEPSVYLTPKLFIENGDITHGAQYLYLYDGEDWLITSTENLENRKWSLVEDNLK